MNEFKGTGKGAAWQVSETEPYKNKHGVFCIDIACESASVDNMVTVYQGFGDKGFEEAQYNAQLISCAPELLSELKHLVNALETISSFGATKPIIDHAKELINKATTI